MWQSTPTDRTLEDRPLSPDEYALTHWLLAHGTPEAARYLADLPHARVVGRCGCGCASVDFAIAGREAPAGAPLTVLADFQYRDVAGHLGGIFVFARAGRLAGLDVWSIDGAAQTNTLPPIGALQPLGGARAT